MNRVTTPLLVTVAAMTDRGVVCEPVTLGVPLPQGLVHDEHGLSLHDEHGAVVPLQAQRIDNWPDGSIRWALLDFQLTGTGAAERRLMLNLSGDENRRDHGALTIDEGRKQVTVNTGAARFVLRTGALFPFASVAVDGTSVIDGDGSGLVATTPDGRRWFTKVTGISVEENGPLRSTLRLDAVIGPERHALFLVTARLRFFLQSSAVGLAVTIRNPRRARHHGGIWELGDNGSRYLRDLSLHVATAGTIAHVDCSCDCASPFRHSAVPIELHQDSSGGEHWRHRAHVDRHGDIPCAFRGYRFATPDGRVDGMRATPAFIAHHAGGVTGIAAEHFWQNWPKTVTIEPDRLIWRFFPGQTANEHELQGGEQKTHYCTLIFGSDAMARDARFWAREGAIARLTPGWYCASGAMPHLTPATIDRYQQLVDEAIEGPSTFAHKREAADEYGWRHFGDLPADHENAYSGLDEPVVSHYNNQYDAIAGFACQFLRSGDTRWHRLMCDLARHVADIDIYHTDGDKSAYCHGLFWHTAHYVTAGRSTHRSFPRHPKVHGGGPSNEHNYTGGLRLHWLLTGDRQSRESANELAGWVIAMDDGRRTPLRWISQADTGLASQTYSPLFHGPGRGAGHSILALLDGHRLTGEQRYLDKADVLVRRCIHPADNIEAHQLLDAERRWSYTIFLQALGRYLDYRIELGRLDEHYAYARASLIHYARWMAEHEYPYLEKPEILEYPTETWAAQDMRKCEVLLYAAAHTRPEDREQMLERAAFFFDASVSTLLRLPSRTLTRPKVLMLTNGHQYLCASTSAPRPPGPAADFGAPVAFVPQKALAKQRLALSAGAFAIVVAATVLTLTWVN